MAEALKHFFDARLIESLADDLARVHPALSQRRFVPDCLLGLDALELTARGAHIAEVMRRHLPGDYPAALRLLLASLGAELEHADSFGMTPFR